MELTIVLEWWHAVPGLWTLLFIGLFIRGITDDWIDGQAVLLGFLGWLATAGSSLLAGSLAR